MYTFMIYKRIASSVPNCFTNLQFIPFNASVFASKSFSSLVAEDDKLPQKSFLVSYLVNSCGLSQKRAEEVISIHHMHNKLKIDSPEKFDAVLEFLKNHGFTATDFSKIFNVCPKLLRINNPEKTLLPKFQFLYSIGFSKEETRQFFRKTPFMMERSLEKHIIPLHGFIRSVLGDDDKAVTILKRGGWLLLHPHASNLVLNISLLRENGVPQSRIRYFLLNYTEDLVRNHSDICKLAKEVLELGFDPTKTMFFLAIHAMAKRYKSTRERCIKVYKEFGWSEENIQQAFLKHPNCLILSEKKLRSTLEFLIKKEGYQAKEICCCSNILCLSLERRTIPRCSVIRALSLIGLTEKRFSLATVLSCSEANFLDRFVHEYGETAPQLLNVYQGKLDPFDLLTSVGQACTAL